ncbi:hypothetical protein [Lapillicoccus sp.]|uniref:hypothetical protein n=1 Tax=Lapillicoccus sp. TaxID=1909287 RepID=UPI00398398CE
MQVEIRDWSHHDIDALIALREEGAVFSSMTGYLRGGSWSRMPSSTSSRPRRRRSPWLGASASPG